MNKWILLDFTLPKSLSNCIATTLNDNEILIIGGISDKNEYLNMINVFNTDK